MNLLTLLIWLIMLGLIAYCIMLLPLPYPFRQIIWVVLVIVLILGLFGMINVGGPIIVRNPQPVVVG